MMANPSSQSDLFNTEVIHANSTSISTTLQSITTLDHQTADNDSDALWGIATVFLGTPPPLSPIAMAVNQIQLFYTPVLVIMGSIANIIAVIATMGSVLRKLSSSHYMCAIALANTLYLAMLFLKWLTILGYNVYHRAILCQLVDMLCNISSFLSIWFVVALCVDRYIAICWPVESPSMCTVMRTRIVITLLVVISLVIYLNTSLTVGVVPSSKRPVCRPMPMPFRTEPAFRILDIVVNHAIPFTSISILLLLIARAIYKSRRGLNPLYQADNSQLRHATLIYLLAFLLFQVPADALKTGLFIHREVVKSRGDKSHATPMLQLGLFVAEYLAHTGMGMNLVLLSASYPLFRQSLKQTMTSFSKSLLKVKTSPCCNLEKQGENGEHVQLKESCKGKASSIEVCISGCNTRC